MCYLLLIGQLFKGECEFPLEECELVTPLWVVNHILEMGLCVYDHDILGW